LVFALAFPAAGAASAAILSDTPSSVDQYVESVPTANGKATHKATTTPRSRKSAQALEAVHHPVAAALKTVATSSVFGAPDKKLVVKKHAPTGRAGAGITLPSASFLGSLKETGGSLLSGGGRLLGLLAGLALISVGAALLAGKKNRSASSR
jgi:hypothetical protein